VHLANIRTNTGAALLLEARALTDQPRLTLL
jgi:hypothetical protein